MAGVSLEADIDWGKSQRAIERLSHVDVEELAFAIGELMVTQTKTRIADEKMAPDGTPWVPWSEAYDETRLHGVHSLLVGEGNPGLLESVSNYSSGTRAEAGTNLVYGAIHQFGSATEHKSNIPERPYLGLSHENRDEVEELVADTLEDLIR